jgi:signal transduction histidine kinase/ActR/RegA family two-component response regulator
MGALNQTPEPPARQLPAARPPASEPGRAEADRRLAFLAEASAVLASSLDYQTTLDHVARLAVPTLADWCIVEVAGEDGSVQRVATVAADPAAEELGREVRRRWPPPPDAENGLARVLRTGKSEFYPDIPEALLAASARDPEHLEMLRRLGLRSGMLVPLAARGRTLGAVTLLTAASGRRYTPDDLALAEDLGRRCALAVDNARLYQEAREAARSRAEALQLHRRVEDQLTLLVEASRGLVSSLEPPAVLAGILDVARRLVAADAYAIWRYDAGSGRWAIASSAGLSEGYRRGTVPVLDSTPQLSSSPVVAEDVLAEPRLAARRAVYRAEGIRSLLAVPLQIHGTPCGTLAFYYRSPHRFGAAEVRVATALANLAASALGSAELYEQQSRMRAQAEEAQRRLALLAEASAALSSTLNEEVTLQSVACVAVPALADWCVVELLREDGSLQRFVGNHSEPGRDRLLYELLRHCRQDALPGASDVLLTGKPEAVNAVADDWLEGHAAGPEHARVLRALGLGSYLVVPLAARGRVLGAISFASVQPGRYGPADLVLGEDLARRAALAVDHARLYRQARDSDRRKDEFLAMLSHELRNPLAPVLNTLAVLRTRGGGPADLQAYDLIERQVRHMARLVDDLLDVSRVTRGKIVLQKERVDLRVLAARAAEACRPLLEARRHEFAVALPEGPLFVEGDPTRLEQVLTNLLNNAAKYTEPGGRVELRVERVGGDAAVRVRDTGIGMMPEVVARAFDLFVQGDRALARSEGGLGIGLTMVRSLVEMHGGAVSAHSDGPGRGSEFVVRLPGMPGGEEGPEGPREAAAPAPRGCRILVVDDNRDSADSLALLLRLTGHAVQVAYDGRAALEAALAGSPEVVFLDIGLPGMDGHEVARRLRAQGGMEGALLVAVSGYGQEEDRVRSLEAGFDHHLVKPVEPEAVQALLAERAAAV